MRLIAGCDLETTGLSQEKGHRIIEICVQLWDVDSRQRKLDFTQRVNPMRTIDPKAEAVHGISLADLVDEPTWEEVAPKIGKILKHSQLLVAHNMEFDGPFMGAELLRVGEPIPDIQSFCTMAEGRWACASGKMPKLSELCWSLNVPFDADSAHAASYDVERMMQCLFKGIDLGLYTLPEAA